MDVYHAGDAVELAQQEFFKFLHVADQHLQQVILGAAGDDAHADDFRELAHLLFKDAEALRRVVVEGDGDEGA